MRKFTCLTLAVALTGLACLGAAAQDQKPQPTPVPAPAQAPPPPAPPVTASPAPPPPKVLPTFEEVIDIDACLSSTQVQNGTVEICRSSAGVAVTAGLQGGVLRSLTFKDETGRGVMVQVRPDPIPMGRCWKCKSSPSTGFSCTRVLCDKKTPAPTSAPAPAPAATPAK
jgi:hypothetical protein